MNINKASGSDVSHLVTVSNRPSLDEVDEIRYSENTPNNELTDSESDSSMTGYNCGKFGSLISKKITYDIYKSFSRNNPVFLLESSDNISMYNKAQKAKRVDPKNYQNSGARLISSSTVKHRTSTGVQYDVPSDNHIHYSRSNSMCHGREKTIPSKSTAHSHTGLPSVTTEKKKCAEKMTYCRPVYNNCYNEEFVFKTMEKNKRLKKLVEKLASAREREKQEDAWHKYINELKNKHRLNAGPRSIPMPPTFDHRTHAELIENFYKTRFQCKQSNLCGNLLKDLYEPCTTHQNIPSYNYLNLDYDIATGSKIQSSNMVLKRNINGPYVSPENKFIFNRDMIHQGASQYYSHPIARNVYSNTIFVDREYGTNGKKYNKSTAICKKRSPHVLKTSSIQTNLKLLPLKDKRQEGEKITDKYNKVSDNINRIKEEIDNVRVEHRQNSLESIEGKLDVLIRSVNTLIAEFRERGISRNSSTANNNIITISRSVDAVVKPITEYMFDLANSVPNVNSPRIVKFGPSKMNNIIVKEMDKSDELKRDIDNILNGKVKKSYAIQITDDIPTKDNSTEVTASLSKTGINKNVEEVKRDFNDGRMAIAVNTDPLGLLSLLRISREAVRNILSYMPSIPYPSAPLLPEQRENVTPFICSICGAAFAKPSELTEHNHSHVRNRDCCVCRHLMGVEAQNPRRIFFCEYCGKPFSRAYCCELHQQTCARRLGRVRDVTSSLVLLR